MACITFMLGRFRRTAALAAGCMAGLTLAVASVQAEESFLQPALGRAADFSPVYPTSAFPAGTREIIAVFQLAPGETFKSFTGQLVAVDVGTVAPPNFHVARAELKSRVGGRGSFHFSLPRPFPPGRYRLDATGDSRLWKSAEFTVADAAAATSLPPASMVMPLSDGQSWTYDFLLETGPGVHLTLDNATAGADGKFRGTETERVLDHDAAGARIEFRLGPTPLEEWLQIGSKGLVITQRKIQGEMFVFDPPQLILPWPPRTPQSWDWRHKDRAVGIHQTSHMWGPVSVIGPKGPTPGFVVLTQEQEPNSPLITFERHYVPGFGKVREVLTEAIDGNLIFRQLLTLKN